VKRSQEKTHLPRPETQTPALLAIGECMGSRKSWKFVY